MKKFVVQLSDKQRNLMSESLITAHVFYLKSLEENGILHFCGPCMDGTALMIVNASSLEEAQHYVEKDPFSKVNYYRDRKVVEIQQANIENNFLLDSVLDYLKQKQS